ncbi:CHASE3 domain-containing protein [Herbaspirillum sp. AP02]|uniref:methyl-accepting chemotaxis protein n=1 Tax=unclassified Herbaspirillum TaxID=2624150 RepID=UPI0015DB2A2E|nr:MULTISPECIES: methyl-accepting chemotaxis protein [unclassified Herbaspirillum]MBG7621631.1 CHASE3 domain-containing protein [Herbaspirillum sp. AP02]NZD69718.1 CHASE3 domain-containing protein [Herbaspirillum sp. AP21]
MLSSLTVAKKLGLAFSSIVVVSLVGSAISLMSFRHQEQVNALNQHTYEVIETGGAMLINMVNMETGVRGYLVSGNENFLAPYRLGKENVDGALSRAKSLTTDNPVQQNRLIELQGLRSRIEDIDGELIRLRESVNTGASEQSLVSYFSAGHDKIIMDRYRETIRQFVEEEQALLSVRRDDLSASSRMTIFALLGSGAFIILLSMGVGYVLTRSISRALGGEPEDAKTVAQQIAAGNLCVLVPVKTDDDHSLMSSLGRMKDQLTVTVRGIQASGESIALAAGEIATGNTDLSERTEAQASSLEETASSLEELTATVRQNFESAKQANNLTINASQIAAKGGEAVGRVVDTMSDISESSAKVSEIIAVIEAIAFQTNILALNAAVESARAGEQGRGFAVVASEVRSLAQRSAAAAKDVKDLIKLSSERVARGTRLVVEAGEAIDDTVIAVRRVTDIMREITEASSEQTIGIEQVNQAVLQMDQMTQQNAALVEEVAAGAKTMAEQAIELRSAVSVFRLDQASEAAVSAHSAAGHREEQPMSSVHPMAGNSSARMRNEGQKKEDARRQEALDWELL